MKHIVKLFFAGFLLLLTLSFLRASTVHAALIVSDGMAASLVLGQPNFTSNTAATTQTGMNFPYGAAVDPTTGKVFIADFANHRVLRFASVTSLTNGAAAEAVLGQPNFTSNTPATTQSGMFGPRAVFVDASGRLWVSEVANNRVLRFDNASSLGNGANADGVLGQTLFTTNASATTQNGMWLPEGIFVDSAGRLWVADSNNYRVLRFDNAAAKSNGANADGVLGQTLFTTQVAATSQSGMYAPYGVHLDSAGRLWVADHVNNRLLRFDNAAASPNGDNADGVLGQPTFTSNASATTQSGMSNPTGVTGNDNTGQIFLADRNNNRILVFNNAAAKVNGDNADNVIGQANFTSNGAGLTATTLNNPYRIYFDPGAEVLWVGDGANHRVLMYGVVCPSSITVMNNNDSGAGSLRQAIADICDGGTITFDNSLSGGTIALTSVIIIDKNVTIDGSSLASQVAVSGGGSTGMFAIYYADIYVTFNNMMFTGANASQDPFGFTGDGRGGAFHNAGHLTINNSTLSNNAAGFAGGAIYNDPYHAVSNGGPGPTPTLVVNNSTFYNNTTTRYGGAVMNEFGQMTISNSTFYQNSATFNGNGGAIMNQFGVSPSGIYNSTIANNTASSVGGGVWLNGNSSISFSLNNVILANNIAPVDADCWKAASSILNGNRNIIETGACPGPTNTITSDPNLGPLASNGGDTETMALLPGSPALDTGDDAVCAAAPVNNLDQRGIARPFGPHCDIGAYEFFVPPVIPGVAGGLGPGGVGHTDGTSTLELWLRSDKGVFSDTSCATPATNGEAVGCWQDQSGNDLHVTRSTLAQRPIYQTAIVNNLPALTFSGTQFLERAYNSGFHPSNFTLYAMSAITEGTNYRTPVGNRDFTNCGYNLYATPAGQWEYWPNGGGGWAQVNGGPFTLNQWEMLTATYDSVNHNRFYANGNLMNTNAFAYESCAVTGSTPDFVIGNIQVSGAYPFIGNQSEFILYSLELPSVERILVDNYLSAKYNQTLPGASDVYDGDTNGDFDLDVAGIGRLEGVNHSQAHGAGMIVVNGNFLQDNGDWLLFGHRTLVNSNTTTELPSGGAWDGINDVRWARHWYIDVTDAVGVDCATPGTCFVDIVFDFSEAGMNGGLPPNGLASNYRLLKRTLDTGPFSDIATATAVVGDQVQFLNVDVSLLGSNFTLGSIDGAASPTAITMHNVASSISQPGYPILIAVLLVLLMAVTAVVWRRRA